MHYEETIEYREDIRDHKARIENIKVKRDKDYGDCVIINASHYNKDDFNASVKEVVNVLPEIENALFRSLQIIPMDLLHGIEVPSSFTPGMQYYLAQNLMEYAFERTPEVEAELEERKILHLFEASKSKLQGSNSNLANIDPAIIDAIKPGWKIILREFGLFSHTYSAIEGLVSEIPAHSCPADIKKQLDENMPHSLFRKDIKSLTKKDALNWTMNRCDGESMLKLVRFITDRDDTIDDRRSYIIRFSCPAHEIVRRLAYSYVLSVELKRRSGKNDLSFIGALNHDEDRLYTYAEMTDIFNERLAALSQQSPQTL